MLGADNAIGASVGTAPIVQRPLVPFGHDGVFEAGRPGWVVLVHDAVVENAKPNGDASLPEQFFTSLKGQPKDQIRDQVQRYLDANWWVRDELQRIRQPAVEFRQRCGVPETP